MATAVPSPPAFVQGSCGARQLRGLGLLVYWTVHRPAADRWGGEGLSTTFTGRGARGQKKHIVWGGGGSARSLAIEPVAPSAPI